MLAQVAPSAVQLESAGAAAADGSNGSAASSCSDAACQNVVERGAVAHWEGFEAVCYDILYNQVLPCLCAPLYACWVCAIALRQTWQLTHYPRRSSAGSRATRAACSSRSPCLRPRHCPGGPSCLGMHLQGLHALSCRVMRPSTSVTCHSTALTPTPGPQADQERLTQLFFEQFNVNALFLCDQAVLSLYALGKMSGTVIDLGHGKVGARPGPDSARWQGRPHAALGRTRTSCRCTCGLSKRVPCMSRLIDCLKPWGSELPRGCVRVAANAAEQTNHCACCPRAHELRHVQR